MGLWDSILEEGGRKMQLYSNVARIDGTMGLYFRRRRRESASNSNLVRDAQA